MSISQGTRFGRYEIISPLGAGGMGEVYLALDKDLDRHVALKFLPTEVTHDPLRLQRFVQEAKAASALNHPNVAHVYEIGEADGARFIAMEYVEGQSLDRKVGNRPLSLSEIVQFGVQAADALHAAHSKGIIHRDIKSANLIVTKRDQLKVLDFGLAKVQRGSEEPAATTDVATQLKTGPGVLMGTVPYMSPEQALGGEIDHRSDIFSLGIVLYQMATGRLPFSGKTATETVNRITNAQPEAIARFNYDVPVELERIVRKCLEKERERRYQSAADLVVDLENLKRDSGSQISFDKQATSPTRGINRSAMIASVLLLTILVGGGVYIFRRGTQAGDSSVTTNVGSIAVLPFANSSGDQNTEYLSDGITESIINSLSQLPNLRVMARTTVFRYKGKDIDPERIGRELGVDAVLTGRALQQGDTLVIQADLVNVSDGSQLWGERFNRKLADVFSIQDEIAKQIAERLRLRLTGEEQQLLTKRYTENTEAYELYLKGRYFSSKLTEEGLSKSIDYFRQAVALDPNYAHAYVGLSNSYAGLGSVLGYRSPAETFPQARVFAEKALEIDEKLAEAHHALAAYKLHYEWNWTEAEKELKRAIELKPNYNLAHSTYGTYLQARGRLDEAVSERKLAQKFDPLSPTAIANVGYPFYYKRQFDEAIKHYLQALDLDQNYSWGHLWIGQAYVQKGMYKEAEDEINQAIRFSGGDVRTKATLGHAYAVAGKREEALRVLKELRDLSGKRYVSPYFIALIYVGLKEDDQAVTWLQKAADERHPYLILMKVEPVFDRLHSDPRFIQLQKRVGLIP
jgi:serine/threonine protein kinase/tetratricopeptide (TPR) repeat protein